MKIAVTSQNRRDVTEHAGRCRNFWVFDVEDKRITGKRLLELLKEQSFHDSSPHDDHPLDDVDVLIAGGMGRGLMERLASKNIECVITSEADPEKAVLRYLVGKLPEELPRAHAHGRDQEPA